MGLSHRKEGIERIDTNILARLILKDNPKQIKKVRKLFSQKEKLFVFEDSSMMEIVFVLSGEAYRMAREQIVESIKNIMLIPNLVCNKGVIEGALDLYVSHPKLSFVDCYLATVAEASGELPLWTFDQKFATQCPIAKEL